MLLVVQLFPKPIKEDKRWRFQYTVESMDAVGGGMQRGSGNRLWIRNTGILQPEKYSQSQLPVRQIKRNQEY